MSHKPLICKDLCGTKCGTTIENPQKGYQVVPITSTVFKKLGFDFSEERTGAYSR